MISLVRQFFRTVGNVIQLLQLDPMYRRLTFYSEGRNYWPHLEGLIRYVLDYSDVPVCYVSSGSDDPGLSLRHPNFRSFLIDEGFVRNWLFENIDARVMVMTMPDLDQYQVKRSRHPVHYVYVQHSLVSFHMVYRRGAFDAFDTIFCAGPHHIEETRALESYYSLPQKNVFAHGYGRLDSILKANENLVSIERNADELRFLLAPSWGPNSTIESGAAAPIVAQLLRAGHRVTLRPHPQTIKFARPMVDAIVEEHVNDPRFTYEDNVAGFDSLLNSDVMISDWSGAAFDYALGLGKPVVFIDVPRKVNNPDYESILVEPIEIAIRQKIGQVVEPGGEIDIEGISFEVADPEQYVFNVGHSAEAGAVELLRILKGIGNRP